MRKFRVFQPGLYVSADLQAGKLRYVRQAGGVIEETEETHAGGDALAAQAEASFLPIARKSTRRRSTAPRAAACSSSRSRSAAWCASGWRDSHEHAIPMVDPAGEYRSLKAEIDAAVGRVFASGRFVLGPGGRGARARARQFVGAAHAVGCNSGTDALHLPLVAAGIGPGDEVVIPGFTFFATGEAVSYTGATPVFADVDEGTFNLDPLLLQKSITQEDQGGHRGAPFRAVRRRSTRSRASARRRSSLLVEDCAQCIGADYEGRRAGSWGDFGGFSFYPDEEPRRRRRRRPDHDEQPRSMTKTLRMLRHHGSRQTYLHERVGWNSRLDELQAAVLRVKLKHLDALQRGAARGGAALPREARRRAR